MRIAIVLLTIAALVACGSPPRSSSLCAAGASLRAAIRAIDGARAAAASNDRAVLDRQVQTAERQIRASRARLNASVSDRDAAAARAMIEAANYLDYLTAQYRSTGRLDLSLTQFASRELTRAESGAGGPPLNC